jgi:hypothetical protein
VKTFSRNLTPPALAVAAAVLLAACSGSGGVPANKSSPASPAPQSTAANSATPSNAAPPAEPSGTMTKGVPTSVNTAAAKRGDQSSVLLSLPGQSSTTCLVVGGKSVVHSGSMGAGDFVAARAAYAKNAPSQEVPTVSLYFIPQHAKKLGTLHVQVTPLASGKAKALKTSATDIANVWKYFPMTVPVPSPGQYRLRVTAGADEGCFVVTFAR